MRNARATNPDPAASLEIQLMKNALIVFALTSVLAACAADVPDTAPEFETVAQETIYGADDRLDWYAHPDDGLRDLTSNAIVALIRDSGLDTADPEDVLITAGPLGPSRGLCDDERFYDQPRSASCSGTLIDTDLILTAGHCVDNDDDCRGLSFVFDFYYEEEGTLKTINLEEDVYNCDGIVVRELFDGMDYAIIRLDRQVDPSHIPALVREGDDALERDDPLVIIGFGSGLPAKIDNGGHVTNPRADELVYFNATTDAFGGNSGSGVFNEDSEVVGILVRGATDYIDDEEAGCQRVNVLPANPGSGGEDSTYAFNAVEALCASGVDSVLCGGPGGWCRLCDTAEDCVEGWACGDSDDGTGLSWCAPECGADEDCRGDHTCTAGGFCTPRLLDRCFEDDVWFYNSCGRRLDVTEDCGREQFCVAADCIDGGPGNACVNAVDIAAVSQTIIDTIDESYQDTYISTCGGDGSDRMYAFRIEEETRVLATARGFDTVLYTRQTCEGADTESSCNDNNDPPGNGGSQLDIILPTGNHFLFVDAFGEEAGEYELQIQFLPVCTCEQDEQRCTGGSIEQCSNVGGLCPEWIAQPCGRGMTCVNLECVERGAYDTCEEALIIDATEGTYSGDLSTSYGNDVQGECGGAGPDEIYLFSINESTEFWAQATGSDTVLHVREDCLDATTEVECNDDSSDAEIAPGSTISRVLPPGTYHLVVDAFDWETAGEYRLDVRFGNSCVDQCDLDRAFICGGPTGYRTCGQYDEDSCSDLSEEFLCEGEFRCSDLHDACIDPENPPDPPENDIGVGPSDTGVDSSTGDAPSGDGGTSGGGGGSGGSTGGGGGCATAQSGPSGLLLLLGLLGLRRWRR